MRDKKGVFPDGKGDGEEQEGAERGITEIRIYYMGEKNQFSIRGKNRDIKKRKSFSKDNRG